jgi:uncharacterized protein
LSIRNLAQTRVSLERKEQIMSETNIQTVKDIYANFGSGNVAGILAVVDANAEWINSGPSEVPYTKHRKGTAEIMGFFDAIYSSINVTKFEPREFVAANDEVVVFGTWGGTAKPTGRSFESDWAMRWCFKNNKVTYFRSFEDMTSTAAAFRR